MPMVAIATVAAIVAVSVQNVQQRMPLKVLLKGITVIVITATIVITAIKMFQSLSVKQTQLQSLLQRKLLLVLKLHRALMVKSVVAVVVTVVAVVVEKMSAMNVVSVLKVIHLIQLQFQQVHLQAHQ